MATWKKVVVSGSSAELAGLTVDATITGDISGNAGGNAASATALETARNIGGVSFDGTADINLPGVNSAGTQDTSGNAATATALETSRELKVSLSSTSADSFDGSGNATAIGVSGTLGTAQGGLGFVPTLVANKIIKVKSDGSGFELADDDAGSVTADSTTTFTNKTIDVDATGNSITNIADANIKVGAAIAQSKISGLTTALGLKAPLASPTFTGTVSGITKAMVGLGNVDDTADSAKPVSTLQQTALDLKANIASPTFTGTVSGITKAMVGLGSVDNTADSAKPVSTLQQTALDAKQDTINAGDLAISDTSGLQTALDSKIGAADTALTGTTTAEALSVSGNVTLGDGITDSVTVEGDLRVKGTASFESSENLLVKDQFIGLGSGSAQGQDGGIVIEDSTSNGGQGHAFAWKDATVDTNGTNRWVVAKDVPFNSTTISADAFMAAVLAPAAANTVSTIDALNSDYNKTGNIYTSNANDIWIYA
jgi:hypothetical protein